MAHSAQALGKLGVETLQDIERLQCHPGLGPDGLSVNLIAQQIYADGLLKAGPVVSQVIHTEQAPHSPGALDDGLGNLPPVKHLTGRLQPCQPGTAVSIGVCQFAQGRRQFLLHQQLSDLVGFSLGVEDVHAAGGITPELLLVQRD